MRFFANPLVIVAILTALITFSGVFIIARPKAVTEEKIIITLSISIPMAIIIFLLINSAISPGRFDVLAKCLTEAGVKMYGAWWCPHCKNQKDMFGKSFRYINYVECAVPGSRQGQTRECQDAGIEGYPTWIFPDGRIVQGEVKPEKFSDITNCPVQ